MSEIRITGLGVVNRAGTDSSALWEALQSHGRTWEEDAAGKTDSAENGDVAGRTAPGNGDAAGKTAFEVPVPRGRLRKVNRYCRLGLYASLKALEESAAADQADPYRRGTIFQTGYASMTAQIAFCRDVDRGDPDFCSPAVFTGTVPNSCVGTVCMFTDSKGVSTALAGGNHLEYAGLLLQTGKADTILAGAVEEYTPELFGSLGRSGKASHAEIEEGTVVLLLERTDRAGTQEKSRGASGYCRLGRMRSVWLGGFPLISDGWKEAGIRRAQETVRELVRETKGQIDGVFISGSESEFDRAETGMIAACVGREKLIPGVKRVTGETLGTAFSMHAAAAALCLKHGRVPAGLTGTGQEIRDCRRLLVTGCDTAGNYCCGLLEREPA